MLELSIDPYSTSESEDPADEYTPRPVVDGS
jgi:hypothetical protein